MFSLNSTTPAEQPMSAPAAKYTVEFFLEHAKKIGYWQQYDYSSRLTEALCFTDRDDYLAWVKAWKETYRMLTADARLRYEKDPVTKLRKAPKHTRATRWAMCILRAEGKKRSWQLKQARLAGSS